MAQGLLIAICLWIFYGGFLPQLHSATVKESQYFETESERLKVFVEKLKGFYIPEINPCDDYLGYTGGNLSLDLAIRVQPSQVFKWFFYNNIKNNENLVLNGEKQMKIFFESCYNNLPDTFEESVKNVDFKDIGHFPVLEANWSEEKFSWINTEARLQNYGMQFLLETKVRETNDTFTLGPVNIFDFNLWSHSKSPKEFEIILNHLGFVSDVILNLKNIFVELESKFRLLYDIDIKGNEQKTIRWLQEYIPKIDWIEYFGIISSDAVKDTDFVNVQMPETIKAIIDLAENTDKRILANYYIYRIYLNLYKEFDSLSQNKEKCYDVVYKHFKNYAPNLILENYFDEHDLINLNNSLKIAIKLRSELQNQEKNSIGLEINKKYLQDLLNIFQNRLNNTKFTTNYYDDIELNKNDFFKNSIILKNLNNQNLSTIEPDPNLSDILPLYQTFVRKPRIYQSFIFSLYPYTDYSTENEENLSKVCMQIRLMQKVLNLFTKSLSYFKEDNEEWFSNEHTFLTQHSLTYKKIFFTFFGHFYSPNSSTDDPMKILLGLEEFVNEYQCTENKIVKNLVKSC